MNPHGESRDKHSIKARLPYCKKIASLVKPLIGRPALFVCQSSRSMINSQDLDTPEAVDPMYYLKHQSSWTTVPYRSVQMLYKSLKYIKLIQKTTQNQERHQNVLKS